jgi:organic hydroperoxide reductase OsmC/OhrA
MSMYQAEVVWKNDSDKFTLGRYSRAHLWRFDGGVEVQASASPQVVPLPFSTERAVDPEEAFVAALSSCHMLWFLSLAAKRGFLVESYLDRAIGELGKDEEGRTYIARVTLHPEVCFNGPLAPAVDDVKALHEAAHGQCFIANSVKTEVLCNPRLQSTLIRPVSSPL